MGVGEWVGEWVWWCADGAKSFGPMNSEIELELLMASTDSMCVCL